MTIWTHSRKVPLSFSLFQFRMLHKTKRLRIFRLNQIQQRPSKPTHFNSNSWAKMLWASLSVRDALLFKKRMRPLRSWGLRCLKMPTTSPFLVRELISNWKHAKALVILVLALTETTPIVATTRTLWGLRQVLRLSIIVHTRRAVRIAERASLPNSQLVRLKTLNI